VGQIYPAASPAEATQAPSPGLPETDAQAYRILAEHLGDIVLVHEHDILTWASESVTRQLGYRPHDMIGRPWQVVTHPDDVTGPVQLTQMDPVTTARGRLLRADGTYAWFETTTVARFSPGGRLSAVYTVARNVDAQQQLAETAATAEKALTTLTAALEASNDGFGIFDLERDPDGTVVTMWIEHLNSVAAAREGKTPDELRGQDMCAVNPDFRANPLWDQIVASAAEMSRRDFRRHTVTDDGTLVASIDYHVAPVNPDRVAVTFRNVTEDERRRRDTDQARARAEHAATHDPLTGLPNRSLALVRLEEALLACHPDERVALVYCDLNRFKDVNDAYGHAAGDDVLRATADRLRAIVRPEDTAARLAGDEFCVILRHLPVPWDADRMRARITDHLAQPVPIHDLLLATSASVGIVVADPGSNPDDRVADQLFATADYAMYQHKARRWRTHVSDL